jgi:hypothetical protein
MAEVRKDLAAEAETMSVGPQGPPVAPGESATLAPAEGVPAAEECPNVPGFEIVEELGRGGMGVVYKARQLSLNRFVALKMILAGPYAGADQLARFRVEAESVARLQHPGIVQIHEIGSHAGHSYLALEYVPGGTLARRCGGQPLPPAEAARLVEVLARAVHYAHQRGIIHRDLKPGNVLLTEDGQPKIADFGLAKVLDAGPGSATPGPQTQSGAILGTPAYMAPEQAGGKRGSVGPLADVYALGAILYELLAGRPPFLADSPVDVILKVATEEPVPPRRAEPGCPRDLEAVCLKCLQKDPVRRYASAAALADDLVRFLKGEPTLARPATRGARFRRWAWRRRWWLAGCGTMTGLLLLLLVSLALNAAALFFVGTVHTEGGGPPVAEAFAIPSPAAPPVALPDDLDLVPRDAAMFVTVRVADLWKRSDAQGLKRLLGGDQLATVEDVLGFQNGLPLRLEEVERLTLVNLQPDSFPKSFVAIVRTTRPYDRQKVEEQLARRWQGMRAINGKNYFGPDAGECVCTPSESVLVYSPREEWLTHWAMRLVGDAPGLQRPALDLAAGGRHHLVAGCTRPHRVSEAYLAWLREPARGLRPETAVAPPDLRPVAEIQTADLTADLKSRADAAAPESAHVELRLRYADPEAAQKGRDTVVGLLDFLARVMKLHASGVTHGVPPALAEDLTTALRAAQVDQDGREGRVILRLRLEPRRQEQEAAFAASVERAADTRSFNNLGELSLGILDGYVRTHEGHLPPAAITDKDGKPLLSWRVAILPYINHDALYKEFHLNEPWDSEHNKKLLARMPDCYEPPLKPAGWEPNSTFYQVFTGEQTLFPPGKRIRYPDDIKDGTRNTILIVEASRAVPWTRPADLPHDPDRLPPLGFIFPNGFRALMADGSRPFFPKDIPPATLRALITPAGGEKVTLP